MMKNKDRGGVTSDKKSEAKRDSDKDRQIKRIPIPAQLKLLASLKIPLQMVDPGVYLEVSKKCLNEVLPITKSHKFSSLTDSIEKAISKCEKMIQKGPEDYVRKRKDKDYNDHEIIQLLKQSNYIEELQDMELHKVKNSSIRDKISELLAKRSAPEKPTEKDQWENDYFAYYRSKELKKE